ncbi:GMC family oxidoreductase N-terminal domain-containing protein [Bradyrhizobium sp. 187]|uniref:GMC family oxidoreductase n=1 Tax=Bradyrhizobium sp. 187 TaxID=2782655 RepID=UPI001FFF7005|nr:GMC family oxidoreductase N-terminal domain-containing protein [Bradyrhizobium sp. 187]UPJ71858.1 GMC family oxidoreductase N-terminal domain-containing protein [Bradyrhizobium sp. 187]
MTDVDILIVGGGTAGCVLANRLSADAMLRVMLVEAGRDIVPGAVPKDIDDVFPRAYANPAYFWPDLKARSVVGRPWSHYTQARVMGGGSSVMGMWSLRGLSADYDSWARFGAQGWDYKDVLPYFKRVESDADFSGDLHGCEGPVVLQRTPITQWPGLNHAVMRAVKARGFNYLEDGNGDDRDGIFAVPLSTDGRARVSAASAYLSHKVRKRDNLEIVADTRALRVVFEGKRAIGVEIAAANGAPRLIRSKLTVISCGSLHTPALLFRSAIGPAAKLQPLGSAVVHDNPHVGQNLQNHIFAHLGAVVKPRARQSSALRRYSMTGIRLSSRAAGAPPSDLFLGVMSRTAGGAAGNRLAMLAAILNAPFSRGVVEPDPEAPFGPPRVDFAMLSDPRDVSRLVQAAGVARGILLDPDLKEAIDLPFVVPANPPIRLLNGPGLSAKAMGLGIIAAFGRWNPFRELALRLFLGRGRLLSEIAIEKDFADLVVASATPQFHPIGTCAIGSVVDSSSKVIGVEALHVVDASIIPVIPRANTNLPTLMVAEKCADHILNAFRESSSLTEPSSASAAETAPTSRGHHD